MMRIRLIILSSLVRLVLIYCSRLVHGSSGGERKHHYKPEWKDLDSRPLPQWYDQAKVGIFIHWGVFSVPNSAFEWFWYYWKTNEGTAKFMRKNYAPGFSYQDFAADFKAEFFNASKWANLFKASGANWNSVDTGPRRGLVGEHCKAIKTTDLKFGLYYSLFEWFNPLFLDDQNKNFSTQMYPPTKIWPDLKHIVQENKPSIIWRDGDWMAPADYWNSTDLIAWMYNESPTKDEIVVNDRWGYGFCKHGDFYTC